ncbi:MAG: CoA pyrophosphatase [Sneathiella sp.]|nr:CoA pyrophosphatase [Sneathiella sp.]
MIREKYRSILDPVPSSPSEILDERGAFRGDHDLNSASFPRKDGVYKPAAVLVPIVMRDETPMVIFTKRASHLNNHAGQICFPGGRAEDEDASAVETALRESEEEIGLDPSFVDIVGSLSTYLTVTNYSVTPVVGFLAPGFELTPEVSEVAEIFEVPLDFLMDSKNHKKHSGFHNGVERFWYAMPYQDYYIWGATAGMLKDLSDRIHQ